MKRNSQAPSPWLGQPRLHRQITFDGLTFDLFRQAKAFLSDEWGAELTNSGALRLLILSHPQIQKLEEADERV